MILPIKFAAGLIGNAITQTVRLSANVLFCIVEASLSIALLLVASLQIVGGGTKQGKETARQSWAHAKNSFKCGSFALLQALGLATLASPLLRAAQACSEPIAPSCVFTPQDGRRNVFQRVLGINSWEIRKKERVDKKQEFRETNPKIESINVATAPDQKTPKTRAKKKNIAAKTERTTNEKCSNGWNSLVDRYMKAKTLAEMDAIRGKMALEHPVEYLRALDATKSLGSTRRAA